MSRAAGLEAADDQFRKRRRAVEDDFGAGERSLKLGAPQSS
jgi:hypothetical protein